MTVSTIVVSGASMAGLRAAEELRAQGFDGQLVLVGDEPHLPYDRPPLSKHVLGGKQEPDAIVLTVPGEGGLDGLAIDWELGRRVTALDAASRTVTLDDGRPLPFQGLVIATGATPRRLPGWPDADGVYVLRTVDDCLALRTDLDATPSRIVVVGAGFIGAEVAATCRGRGLDVTLLEALPVPLARGLGEEMGRVCADVHRDHEVDLRLSALVDGIDVDGGGRVARLRLGNGDAVDADVVVVGVGVAPNTGWLDGSGLTVDDGVVCDETCLAGPGIVAAGDVARWPNRRYGESMRVEHWENAQEMGAHAARTLLADVAGGRGEPYDPVPWFWSDQYDRKLQLVGRSRADAEVTVEQGSVEDRKFVAVYRQEGRPVAALGMNMPAAVMRWRAQLQDS
ncbi:MAG: NAD(P)/FAD-dependent oxidoreductase [Acidimicrobiales bacterium]